MTVSSTPSEISYAGDGVSLAFPIPFQFESGSDLKITSTDASGNITTLTTGFVVTGGSGSTGTLTFTTAPASTVDITIIDDPVLSQETDYVSNDAFPAESHERALDKCVRLIKRLHQRLQRSLRTADGDPITDLTLGSVDNRKGKYLFFNAITGAIEYAVALATTVLSQSIIAQLLNPQTTAEAAALVTPTDYSVPSHAKVGYVLPARYGLSTAASAATNTAALDSAEAVIAQLGGGVVRPGPGRFVITNFICATNSYVIEGDGESTTLWDYATPTGDGVAMTFSKGAASISRSGIRRCGFISASSTLKTGVVFNDARQAIFEHVAFNSGNWPGTTSIGLRTYGRDFYRFRDCDIECARPWLVSLNPNSGDLHTDMTAVRDVQFASTLATGKNVELETGVEVTNLSFESVDFAGGKYGFYYVDTTSNIAPYHLSFINCRYEQNADAAGFSYYIETNATLQNAYWEQCHFDPVCGGIHLRNAQKISLKDCTFPGAAGITNLDITFISTTVLVLENTLVQALSTATLTSAVLLWGDESNTSPTPFNALYKYDQAAVVSQKPSLEYNSLRKWSYQGTLANLATLNTPWTRAAFTNGRISVVAYSATGPIHCGGVAVWTKDGTTTKVGGSANFVVAAVGVELRCLDGGSGLVVVNNLGQTVTLSIEIVGV